MTFSPKYWHDGHQTRTVFVVRELRKNVEVLMINSMIKLQIRKLPKAEVELMHDVDFGSVGERKMKSSLRRLAKKKGTPKNARDAVKEVLS